MFTIQIQKEKSMIFSEKNFFGTFLIFFPKGGPLEAKILKNNFFNFSKNNIQITYSMRYYKLIQLYMRVKMNNQFFF